MSHPVPETGPAPDLEYDLAHEASHQHGCLPAAPDPAAMVQVCNETSDYEGDYGYDLAHDIPRPKHPGT
ncbi:MAG TPA: hypothetical protein VI248_22200 [Kineosporiaceae bacterium]